MIIDHIGVPISDIERSKAFYLRALAPLKIEVLMEVEGWVGMGRERKPAFWFGAGQRAGGPVHVAFVAETREQVRAFYAAALTAGGRDNGGPGIRAHYHPDYYGAFVLDPDGNNIEAVCHRPE